MNIFDIAKQNQEKAWQVIKNTNIIQIWEDAGAKINLVGSLRTGLLMKHRDIDFHIYSSPLNLTDSFQAMARLAENPSIKRIECANLLHTAEACIEWHAWYQNEENELWQMDMIHIREGSRYDGYFEKVAQRISEIMTDEIRETILRLKYETPETEKIIGVEYYQAVIRDGVRDYSGFKEWRKQHPVTGDTTIVSVFHGKHTKGICHWNRQGGDGLRRGRRPLPIVRPVRHSEGREKQVFELVERPYCFLFIGFI